MQEKKIGEIIAEAREKANLSQRQLAKIASISNAQLSKIESGEIETPNPKMLRKISQHINVNYNEMMYKIGLGMEVSPLNPFIKDYYNKILKAKTVTEAWNLAQEFKTNFPEDDLLGEALNYAAQLSLNYGMKIHKNGAYSDAASYYNKIINEEKVSSTLRSTAQVYLNQANEGKELTTPKDYYGKVLASKKVSQAWSLAQEFKENFPGNVLLAEAFNHAAQMNLDYAMKLHLQKD